jgi:hypothetical protein
VRLFTAIILGMHVVLTALNFPRTADSVAAIAPAGMIEMFPGEPEPVYPALIEFMTASSLQMCLFLPALAAVIAGQEFRSRQLGQSLLAVPRRGRLIAAKTLATAAFLLVVSALIALVSAAALYAAVRDWDPGMMTSTGALLGQSKFLSYAVLTALVGLAFGILARSSLAGILLTVGLTALTMTQLPLSFAPALDALLPMSAGRNLLLNPGTEPPLSSGPTKAMLVSVAWPLITLAAAGLSLARRDAPHDAP